jgi:hypothetical protein
MPNTALERDQPYHAFLGMFLSFTFGAALHGSVTVPSTEDSYILYDEEVKLLVWCIHNLERGN